MLILSRRNGETITITLDDPGEEIVITVLDGDRPGQTRLGIDAPRRLRILRSELLEEVRQSNQAAVAGPEALTNLSWLTPTAPPPETAP